MLHTKYNSCYFTVTENITYTAVFFNEFSIQTTFSVSLFLLFLFLHFFLLDPDSLFHLCKRHYMSDILFIFFVYILFHISVIMFAPPYNVYCFYYFIMHQMCTRLYLCYYNSSYISNYQSEVILNLLFSRTSFSPPGY